MPTTIKLKNSVTTTNVPSSLAQGEVAINVTDKKVWVGNAATTPVQLLGTGSDGSFTNLTVTNNATFDTTTLVVDATNNRVGVGTASPAYALDVTGDIRATNYVYGNTAFIGPLLLHTGASDLTIEKTGSNSINFNTNGSERMRVNGSGNVGIGTNSPNFPLNIYSSSAQIAIQNASTGSGAGDGSRFQLLNSDLAIVNREAASIQFYTSDTERMRLDSSGNLGIGTSSPSQRLDVQGSSSATTIGTSASIEINSSTGLTDPAGITLLTAVIDSATGGDRGTALAFSTSRTAGTSEKMRIDSSGSLLVGRTTSDGYRISALGNTQLKSSIQMTYEGVAASSIGVSSSNAMVFGFDGATGSTERMRIDSSGNLGLGVTPSAWNSGGILQVKNGGVLAYGGTGFLNFNAFFDGASKYITTAFAGRQDYDSASGAFKWNLAPSGTAGNAITFTQAMTLDASGNLGIGTTAPSTPLGGSKGLVIQGSGADAQFRLLNSTSGSTGADGVLLSIDGSLNGYLWNYENSNFVFGTNNTERMRLDSSGNLLVGTTSGFNIVANRGNISINGSNEAILSFGNGGINSGFIYSYSTGLELSALGSRSLIISTNNTERMRVDQNGVLLIGGTTPSYSVAAAKTNINGGSTAALLLTTSGGASYACQYVHNTATSGNNEFVRFGTEGTWTDRGGINYNRGAGLTVYNTTSDYRAKDIISPVLNSGEVIDSVPVYMGKMKDATQVRPMFIAHETPDYAHTGEKDAVDENGNPIYQQMDASTLVPVLWAEIQQLRKRVALLESK